MQGKKRKLLGLQINILSLALALLIHNKQINISDFIRLFLQAHRETDRFFAVSGVQSAESNLGPTCFHFRRATVLNQLKSKCGLLLTKTDALRVTLNLDDSPIVSHSHTHPSHSQISRLLTLSLSLGVPVPRPTQCIRDS
jgi:hypothetical protein